MSKFLRFHLIAGILLLLSATGLTDMVSHFVGNDLRVLVYMFFASLVFAGVMNIAYHIHSLMDEEYGEGYFDGKRNGLALAAYDDGDTERINDLEKQNMLDPSQ